MLKVAITVFSLDENRRLPSCGLAIACTLCMCLSSGALAQGATDEHKTFRLHATVFEAGTPGNGTSSSIKEPSWSPEGIGDGENIALTEEKKGESEEPAASKSKGESQAKTSGGGESDRGGAPTDQAALEKPAATEASSSAAEAKKGAVSVVRPAEPASTTAAPQTKSLDATGVDWSQWANELADRWYKNLIELERKSGKGFNTLRPAKIRFTCYPDGSIKNIILIRSCGVSEYDRMQIQALKKTPPLPPFPAGTKRKSITMQQGWESRRKKKGEKDFELGSYGKRMPVERVRLKSQPRPKRPPVKGAAGKRP